TLSIEVIDAPAGLEKERIVRYVHVGLSIVSLAAYYAHQFCSTHEVAGRIDVIDESIGLSMKDAEVMGETTTEVVRRQILNYGWLVAEVVYLAARLANVRCNIEVIPKRFGESSASDSFRIARCSVGQADKVLSQKKSVAD